METGNHVLLHCPKTELTLVWGQAITLASGAVVGTPAGQRRGGLSMHREGRMGHLLGPRGLVDMPTEVALRGAATHALVSGLSFVDAQLKADRKPPHAMAAEAVKCRRPNRAAFHRSGWVWLGVAGDGVAPLTPVAGGVTAGGQLHLKT